MYFSARVSKEALRTAAVRKISIAARTTLDCQ